MTLPSFYLHGDDNKMREKGLTYTQKRVIITANIINQGEVFLLHKKE